MDPRVPEPIRPLLRAYLSAIDDAIPGLLRAFCLEGSIALGGFNERLSDIDFVAFLDRQAKPVELAALRRIHAAIGKRYPQWPVSGAYLQVADLTSADRRAGPHPACHESVLRTNARFELDSVEGWILQHHGIAVIGPQVSELPLAVDWDQIVRKMRVNLNTYWAGWAYRPHKMAIMISDWGIQWTVLGVLRQFYSFRENTITTKVGAGRYALRCLPARWHPLIQDAIRIRQGGGRSPYRSRVVRAVHAVRFLRTIIRACNARTT